MRLLRKNSASGASAPTSIFEHYVESIPTYQTAIDAVPGWNHAFPPETGVKAGHAHLYDDPRINWCIEQSGSILGKNVLELGPLEAMHTYMLALAGAHHIDAVEANTLAYIRCLISREILKIENASFLLGNFIKWMEQPDVHYDLVVASGVLYHSSDPLRLLELISKITDSFYIWTHYFDDVLNSPKDLRGVPFSGLVEQRTFHGEMFEIHERSYYKAWRDPKFCGGFQDRHFWMKKEDILRFIHLAGFDTATAHDTPEHINGPSISIFAKRKQQ